MTDTTKTEALEWAELAALGSISDHECADLEAFLRQIDASEVELKALLWERALRIRTLEDERDRLAAECEALRGLRPDLPPRPHHNNDASLQHPALPRYGLRWNGPGQPVAVPMADGYWTPFHLAFAAMGGKESQGGNSSVQEGRS